MGSGVICAIHATQGVFGEMQIVLTYLSVSRPVKNVDMTYTSQPHPTL
jgi:hypothetical protein